MIGRRIELAKMSGAGNDFVVLDRSERERLGDGFEEWVRRISRRGVSAGADGVVVVTGLGGGRVGVEFLNPDGTRAFCGNGSRCAARFAVHRALAPPQMLLLTAVGEVPAEVRGPMVRLRLPPPRDLGRRWLSVEGREAVGSLVLSGVPHLVLRPEENPGLVFERDAPQLRRHPEVGPDGANVDWVSVGPGGRVEVRTWERGVEGETLCCGTGAIAAAWVARAMGAGDRFVVRPRSGIPLRVDFPGGGAHVREVVLEGDARIVFEGTMTEEAVSYPELA